MSKLRITSFASQWVWAIMLGRRVHKRRVSDIVRNTGGFRGRHELRDVDHWLAGQRQGGADQAVRCGRSCNATESLGRAPLARSTPPASSRSTTAPDWWCCTSCRCHRPFANRNRQRARWSSRRGLAPRPSAVSTRLVARARRARGHDRDPRPLRPRTLVHGSMARVLHIAECPVLMMRTAGREADHYFSSAEGFS